MSIFSGNEAVAKAVEALKNGTDVEAAAYGTAPTTPEPTSDSNVGDDTGIEEFTDGEEDEFNDSDLDEEEESGEESEAEANENPDQAEEEADSQAASSSDIEELTITDHKGRRTVKVDFSNREQMKKYVQMAALARKMQAERDSGNEKAKKLESEHAELRGTWDKFENAWGDGGREGIVSLLDLIASESGGFEAFMQAEYKRMRAKEDATPSELARIELEEKLERESRERQRLMKQIADEKEAIEKNRAAAEDAKLQSMFDTSFNKYRFAGKLGDEAVEHELDQTIYDRVVAKLDALDDGVEITAALIDKTVRETANFYRKFQNKQAKDTVKRAITQQKKAAGQKVVKQAMSGLKPNKEAASVREKIKSGDWGAALTDVLTGRSKI